MSYYRSSLEIFNEFFHRNFTDFFLEFIPFDVIKSLLKILRKFFVSLSFWGRERDKISVEKEGEAGDKRICNLLLLLLSLCVLQQTSFQIFFII